MSDMPKHNEMKSSLAESAARLSGCPCLGAVLTTLVPPSAKRRNMKVPANSAIMATKWFLMFSGRKLRNGTRRDTNVTSSGGS